MEIATKKFYAMTPQEMADFTFVNFFHRDTTEGVSDAVNNCIFHCDEVATYTLDLEYWKEVKNLIIKKYK